jgi:hypothetical protein
MVNDVLHGEQIVDGTAVRKLARPSICSIMAASIVRISEIRHRSNFNKIRMARRTAFSNVVRMVAFGE